MEISLSHALVTELKNTLLLIEHHESIVNLLKATVQAKLEDASEKNLSTGKWEVDLEAGVLKHAE